MNDKLCSSCRSPACPPIHAVQYAVESHVQCHLMSPQNWCTLRHFDGLLNLQMS